MKLDFSNLEEAPEEFRAVTFNAPPAKKGMRMPSLTALEIQTQGVLICASPPTLTLALILIHPLLPTLFLHSLALVLPTSFSPSCCFRLTVTPHTCLHLVHTLLLAFALALRKEEKSVPFGNHNGSLQKQPEAAQCARTLTIASTPTLALLLLPSHCHSHFALTPTLALMPWHSYTQVMLYPPVVLTPTSIVVSSLTQCYTPAYTHSSAYQHQPCHHADIYPPSRLMFVPCIHVYFCANVHAG